jgi:AcrR family transcriptional regulator
MMANRTERADATREQILIVAERLFVAHGLAVSNRQIGEAAGQGNNSAVGYHFGSRTALIRAIVERHNERIEEIREQLLAEVDDAADVREWTACLVRPYTRHLADLGPTSAFARFGVQVLAEPMLRAVFVDKALNRPSIQRILEGLGRCLPTLPEEVRHERADMARILLVNVCAERERALANGTGTPRASWEDAATGLIDALVAVWLAPVTSEGEQS